MRYFRLVIWIGLAFTAIACRASDLIPREASHLSLRNEVETALRKGREYLRSRQGPDGTWPDVGITGLGTTAFALRALHASGEEEAEANMSEPDRRALNTLRVGTGPKPSGWDFAARLSALLHFQSMLTYAVPGGLPGKQIREPRSPMFGGIAVGDEVLDLPLTALVAPAWNAIPEQSRHDFRFDPKAVCQFARQCQVLSPGDPGGFALLPPLPGKAPPVRLACLSATAAAFLVFERLAPAGESRLASQGAAAWLGRHFSDTVLTPDSPHLADFLMSQALAPLGRSPLLTPEGRPIDWPVVLGERLINAQNGNGSWSGIGEHWTEQDSVLVTAFSVLTMETIYRVL